MIMKLILICKEGEARKAYLNEIAAMGASVDAVSSYSEFLNTKAINPYQGLMIDLVTQNTPLPGSSLTIYMTRRSS
jgi:hypothetical protein